MRRRRAAVALCVAWLGAAIGSGAASAANFTVTNSFDVGAGSLRQAITDANATANTGSPDTISFADLGSSNKITPDTPLPTITEAVVIDGYTHPGASPNTLAVGNNAVLKVELSGEDFLGGAPDGLTITGGGTAVRGLAINRFTGAGIRLETSGGNVVEGNFIGTDINGTADLSAIPSAESNGVRVESSPGNTIGGGFAAARNVISGNGNHGVVIRGAAGTVVRGNYIGTTKSGTVALGNDAAGVHVANDAADTRIGGVGVTARNVISSNQDGVSIGDDLTVRTLVQGNYIGTDATGTADLGNVRFGVDSFEADDGVVGGTAAGEGNVISGNGSTGVNIRGDVDDPATGNKIQGNRIGTNAAGTAALGNGFYGIQVQDGAPDTTVGGVVPGARNVISGNGEYGVYISQRESRVQGNYIGTNAAGTAAIGNGKSGILAFPSGVGLQIGGTVAGARNVVSGNRENGIECLGFTEVIGNYVGLNAAGTAAVPNLNGVAAHTQAFIGLATEPFRAPFGNVISGNTNAGVLIAEFAAHVEVDANLIGTSPAGTTAIPNGDGIIIEDGGSTAAIGFTARNVISGNDFAGVLIRDPGFGHNMLSANYIGLNRAGTAAVPNRIGVEIAAGARDNEIGRQTGGRTVIAGNRFEGIRIDGTGTDHNDVVRAFVGIKPDGAALGNERGVVISGGAAFNTVGGSSALLANTISGNRSDGVLITGAGTNRNVVRGNSIGATPSGNAAIPNSVGVNITAGARFNTIGGPTNQPRSLIAGNTSAGVRVAGADTLGNRIQGNLIGTMADAATPRPNGVGVVVTAGAQATTIGGVGFGNWIAFNTGSGVLVDGASTTGAEIMRNRIFSNGKLGINLRPSGEAVDMVTPNDANDADAGPNALQNFPVITTARAVGTTTTISGTLNSRPNANFRIDVYRNPVGTLAAAAEGRDFVGADLTVTTNASGNATWSLTVPANYGGQVLRATATRLSTRDTSEFSATRVVAR